MRRIVPVVLVVGTVAGLGCESDTPLDLQERPERVVVASTAAAEPVEATHFLVGFGSVGQLNAAVTSVGGTIDRTHTEIGVAQVSGIDGAGAEALANSAGIAWIERDLIVQWQPRPDELELETLETTTAEGPASDPTQAFLFPCQWNMTQCDAPDAWAQGEFGNPNVKVAVLDTGVDPFHQDLAGRVDMANSTSMLSSPSVCDLSVPDQTTFFDFNFHGTFVAGIITSNGIGVAGMAPDATVVGVKVLSCFGSGSFADVIAGVLYATGLPAVSAINMSLGAYFPKNLPGAGQLVGALNKAVNYAETQGKLVVSSAGGNGADLDNDQNFIHVPSQIGSGIAAWAGDVNGNLASYSNHGRSGTWVGAGGGDGIDPSPPLAGCVINPSLQGFVLSVCSTTSVFFNCGGGNNYLIGSGTSFSAPMVAGVAALVDAKYGGGLNGGQLKTKLAQTADDIGVPGVDNLFSHGRVNAGNAVK